MLLNNATSPRGVYTSGSEPSCPVRLRARKTYIHSSLHVFLTDSLLLSSLVRVYVLRRVVMLVYNQRPFSPLGEPAHIPSEQAAVDAKTMEYVHIRSTMDGLKL
ncbi:hypothetical protein PISMIDRAFT_13608 [Pisolithus microcarpus 441]|uniref:Uncharacterized protein n=1 Tax=Pisolithus microcarpus 441 TaxID=765257 RepID=A0A0C9ZAS2_9AGAM|nr:hypothetical protein PISMIDRAFT_13608 [Pisolithus microcarpus 441]